MKTFIRLLTYLRYSKVLVSIGFALMVVATALTVYAPIIASQIIDYVSIQHANAATIDMAHIISRFSFYLILTLVSAILAYLAYICLGYSSNKISRKIRDEAHAHMQKLPVSYFDNIPAGKIAARIVNDTETLRENFYNSVTIQIVINSLTIIGVYTALATVHLTIALSLLTLIPLIILWQWYYAKKVKPINAAWRETVSELNSKIAEIVQGVSIVQAFNRQDHMVEVFEKTNDDWLKSRRDNLRIDSFLTWNLSNFLKQVVVFSVMLYIGTRFNQGLLGVTVGTLYIVIDYVNRLFDPITNIIRLLTVVQQAIASGSRVMDLLDTPIELDADQRLEVTHGNVRFEHVAFAYKEGEPVLKDIDFSVMEGETIGLVGHTGSGKSSIINLLFRFYDPQEGRVLIDGQDIAQYNRESIRERMGIVLQEPYLFTGTIASNISMNNPTITDKMVMDALIKVGAKPMIDRLSKGIHEPVVEKGQSFSSGERQLISFARTLANDPKILILDEATSHIDTETEEIIRHAMDVVKEGRTTFIVAHRLSTIKDANHILVLEAGEIKEMGSHHILMTQQGIYNQMYQMQGEM